MHLNHRVWKEYTLAVWFSHTLTFHKKLMRNEIGSSLAKKSSDSHLDIWERDTHTHTHSKCPSQCRKMVPYFQTMQKKLSTNNQGLFRIPAKQLHLMTESCTALKHLWGKKHDAIHICVTWNDEYSTAIKSEHRCNARNRIRSIWLQYVSLSRRDVTSRHIIQCQRSKCIKPIWQRGQYTASNKKEIYKICQEL